MLQGNSYLRQIWEALVCGFRHQITNLTLTEGGPVLSLAYMESRKERPLTFRELGRFLPNSQYTAREDGCHATPSMASFYWNTAHTQYSKRFSIDDDVAYDDDRANVTETPNNPECKDDLAMVEFGNAIRFYFIFHPSRYNDNALVQAYERLGLVRNKNESQFSVNVMAWLDCRYGIHHAQPDSRHCIFIE